MSPNRLPLKWLLTAFFSFTAASAPVPNCDELHVALSGNSESYRAQRAITPFKYPKDRPAKVIVYAGYEWQNRGTKKILERVSAEAQQLGKGSLDVEVVDTTKLSPEDVKKHLNDHLAQTDVIVFFAHSSPGSAELHKDGMLVTGNGPGANDIDVNDQKWDDKAIVYLGCNSASCVYPTGSKPERRYPAARRLSDTTMRHTGASQVIGATRVGNESDQWPLFRALFAAEVPVEVEGYRSLLRTQAPPELGDTVAGMNALKHGSDEERVRYLDKLADWAGLAFDLPADTESYVSHCLRSSVEKPEVAAAAFRYLKRRPLLGTLSSEIKKMSPVQRYALFDAIKDRAMNENRRVPTLNVVQAHPDLFLEMVEDDPARLAQLIKYYLEVNPSALEALSARDSTLLRPRLTLATRKQAFKKLADENSVPQLTSSVLRGMTILVEDEPGQLQGLIRNLPVEQKVRYLLQSPPLNDQNPVFALAKSDPRSWGNDSIYVRILVAIRNDPALASRGESLGITARKLLSGNARASLSELTQMDTEDKLALSQWLRRFGF